MNEPLPDGLEAQMRSGMSRLNYLVWFSEMRVIGKQGRTLVLASPHEFILDHLTRYWLTNIQRHIDVGLGNGLTFRLDLDTSLECNCEGDWV